MNRYNCAKSTKLRCFFLPGKEPPTNPPKCPNGVSDGKIKRTDGVTDLMSDRLDRIEAILQSTAEQQAANTRDIDALVGAISTTELMVRENTRNIQENRQTTEASIQADREEYRALNAEQSQRIQNLLDDARADRQRADAERAEQSQRIENLLNDARADRQRADAERAEQSQRIENLLNDARADRQRADEYRARADAERAEQSQRIQNLLDEARADRERGDAERAENRRRFDAQQQIIQAMLVELSVVNSRLDFIERAS
jgi:chromosome segregation ATPase